VEKQVSRNLQNLNGSEKCVLEVTKLVGGVAHVGGSRETETTIKLPTGRREADGIKKAGKNKTEKVGSAW